MTDRNIPVATTIATVLAQDCTGLLDRLTCLSPHTVPSAAGATVLKHSDPSLVQYRELQVLWKQGRRASGNDVGYIDGYASPAIPIPELE